MVEKSAPLKVAICDLGAGRAVNAFVTQDVFVTTWPYVAPESMLLSPQNPYGQQWGSKAQAGIPEARDIWAAGCIFAEIIGGEQLFPEAKFGPSAGVQKVAHIFGPLPPSLLELIQAEQLRERVIAIGNNRSMKRWLEENGLMANPEDNPDGATEREVELLHGLLDLDPVKRMTADVALTLPSLSEGSDSAPVPSAQQSCPAAAGDIADDHAARTIIWRLITEYDARRVVDCGSIEEA